MNLDAHPGTFGCWERAQTYSTRLERARSEIFLTIAMEAKTLTSSDLIRTGSLCWAHNAREGPQWTAKGTCILCANR